MNIKKTLKRIVLGTSLIGLSLAGASEYNNSQGMKRDDPKISSEREGVFVPLVNDAIYGGISPFGYDPTSKSKDFIPNLIFGRNHKIPEREDAWRLYLGKPQINNTFSISEYSQNNNEVCYKINDFFDSYLGSEDPSSKIRFTHDLLKLNPSLTSEFGDFMVMGGCTIGLGKDDNGTFLYYYDIWDLDIPIERNGFFGKPFKIYDRLYFDEATYRPERPIKEIHRLDGLESEVI